MPNTDLLRATITHIETHPDTWNQASWAKRTDCGTAYCFAGHAVTLANPGAHAVSEHADHSGFVAVPGIELLQHIPDLARRLLDLTEQDGEILFAPGNTLEDLRAMVEQLCAGHPLNGADYDRAEEA